MMRSSRIILLLAALAVFGTTGIAAYAQQGPAGDALSVKKREQIREKIETVRVWRLTKALKLDAETSAKLASLLNSCDQQRRDATRERREAMRELRLILKARKPDVAKIKTLLDTLENNRRATQELVDKEWKGLQEILTPEQQARFVVFQQDFKREIHRMIAGAHSGQGKGNKGPVTGRDQGPGPGKPVDR